jgi:type IV secretory pathway VirB3-like protein
MSHEDLTRDHAVEGSSDRAFGVVFSVVFVLVFVWPMLFGNPPRWWSAGVAVAFLIVAIWRPALLAGLNQRWIALGLLLGRVVSPVALGVLYFLVVAPLGVIMRLAGKDPLRLRRDTRASSYWIPRAPPGPPPDSMTNQY